MLIMDHKPDWNMPQTPNQPDKGTSFHKTHTSPESALNTIAGIPLGRSGNPEDVARAVTFLASEYDGFITGETIDINGGVYCA